MGHGALGIGQFNEWILDFQFWIEFQSKIQNLKSKILPLVYLVSPAPCSPAP
jgi:hypothetical protein